MYKNKLALSFGIALALAGCGGGGSGGSSNVSTPPVGNSPPTTPTTPTTPTAPTTPVLTVLPAALQTATAATYMAGTSEYLAFKKLNAFRAAQGLGPLNQNAKIDIAAKNHASYQATNQSGGDPHAEEQGKPGFTGVDVQARLITAGYQAVQSTEVIAFSTMQSDINASPIDNLANAIYHRSAMMYQGMTEVGFAPEQDMAPLIADIATMKKQVNAGDYFGVYPANNQTGVWLTHSVESPNPFYMEMEMTQENMCTKTSAPVSVASEASTTLAVTTFTVTEEGQTTPLAVRLITKATSTQDQTYLPANVAFVIGKAPFKANTKYNVVFVGKVTGAATGTSNGLAIERNWSFTTGTYKRGCL